MFISDTVQRVGPMVLWSKPTDRTLFTLGAAQEALQKTLELITSRRLRRQSTWPCTLRVRTAFSRWCAQRLNHRNETQSTWIQPRSPDWGPYRYSHEGGVSCGRPLATPVLLFLHASSVRRVSINIRPCSSTVKWTFRLHQPSVAVRLNAVLPMSKQSGMVQWYNVLASWFYSLPYQEDNGSKVYATPRQCKSRNITPTNNSRLRLFGNYASYNMFVHVSVV